MATKKVKVLRVVSRKDSFRRAGHEFGAEPKNLPLDTLHQDHVSAIKGDPNLVAVEVEVTIDEDGNVVEVSQDTDRDEAKSALLNWASELGERDNALTVRENAVKSREDAVSAAEAALVEREAGLAAREAAAGQAAAKANTAKK
ncbi:hypothetical protein [Cupriavidus basilensis]|uniref:hypothetical protein n=1 Tax=Cupriavidus basilensis TaxID=68895 RepID=UPI0039F68AEA